MPQADSFSGSFEWTAPDYFALCKAQRRWRPSWRHAAWTDYAVWAAIGIVGGWAIWPNDLVATGLFTGAVLSTLALADFVLMPWLWRRQFKSQGLEGRTVSFSADGRGITVSTPTSRAEHAWSNFVRADRLPEHVVLWQSRQAAYILPDRAFAHVEEARAFSDFAKTEIAAAGTRSDTGADPDDDATETAAAREAGQVTKAEDR